MKKYLLLLILAVSLVVGACSNTDETTQEKSSETESTEKQEKQTENEKEKTGTQENEEETKNQADLFDIKLNAEKDTIELVQAGGKTVVLAEDMPSEPVKSPNGEKAAYLSPYGWETMSNLYLVDLHDGSQDVLVPFDAEKKPKEVVWEDDQHVLVIIGYPHGTVSVGGNIYRINIETKETEAVTDYGDEIQITDLRIEDGVLYYSGVQYTDENMNEKKDYSNQISLKTE
ncbi:DUF4652 domain-containing protein [Mesobacillus maritimus]|uniref:DUF4652 domain-containing protein n=1 Tax=Mesobacillus maritimus TaxID=1643336 RepID=UPI00204221B2|nr:DUF4652 domain-containing protein [Mesobacillus maritimus]MCM3585763.1 DUF4652 domain-containing protein [Mesobacillus maritimus]